MKTNNKELSEASFNRFEQILLEHNTCHLCGTVLTFIHRTDFAVLRVEEHSHCTGCNIKTRPNTHTLQ